MEKLVGSAVAPSREAVIRALDNCYDPCCRKRTVSVVDMGLIESIEIEDRLLRIEMVLTTGWYPFASRLLGMVEEEVGALPTVDRVDVNVVRDPRWTPQRMSESAREKLRLPLENLEPLRKARLRGEPMIKDDVLVFDFVAHPFNFDASNAIGNAGELFSQHLDASHNFLTPEHEPKLPAD